MKYSQSWDLSTIPDAALKSERARRNAARVAPGNRAGGRRITNTSEEARKQREYRRERRAQGKDQVSAAPKPASAPDTSLDRPR